MATVFERDGVWIAKWRDAAGRWRQKRTSCATKSEARRLAEDLERKGERQREGLEPLPSNDPPMIFAALLDWWWEEYGQRLRGRDLRRFVDKHLRAPMGNLTLREVSTSQIEGLLQRKSRDLAPKSLNHIRGLFHRIFALAIKREKWVGPNPAAGVERRKAPKRLPQYLRLEEVPRLLNALTPEVATPLRHCDLHGHAPGRVARPQEELRRYAGEHGRGERELRRAHHQGRPC